jgi:hypothetical protein
MDVEATTAIRQAEVGAAKTMLDRTAEQFDVQPSRLVADAGYGSAEMLGWLVDERGIEPHVKVFDKSERTDGALSRGDFAYDMEADVYICPGGNDDLPSRFRRAARRRDERRHNPLSREQIRLRGLRAQTQVLPKRCRPQDRSLDLRSRPRQGPSHRQNGCLCDLTPRAEEGRDAVCASQADPQA